MDKKQFRHQGIDALRIISAFAVVCLHTNPFKYAAQSYGSSFWTEVFFITEKIFKFAVPAFFLTSGYFFSNAIRSGAPVMTVWLKSVRRIVHIYLAWMLFYSFFTPNLIKYAFEFGFPKGFAYAFMWDTLEAFKEMPVRFILEGSAVHLWFLVSLLIGLSLVAAFYAFGLRRWVMPVAGLFYGVGLLMGSYSTTPYGIQTDLFEARHGPFFGFLFLALGGALPLSVSLESKRMWLWFAVIAACIAQIGEAYFVRHGLKVSGFDFSVATIAYGAAAFLLALSYPVLPALNFTASASPYSLGVYTFHVVVWNLLYYFRESIHPILWEMTATFLVFFVSLFCVKFFSRIPSIKKIVT